jgi:chromate transporter
LQRKPSFKEAFWFWLKLGFISFGGPAGQIAIMHEFLVEKKKWISESRFLHALNYSMILPGPEAQQLATYTGWLIHGTRGGLVAGIFFVLPSMFILLVLSSIYAVYEEVPVVYSIFQGLKPAIIAIIILALIKIGRRSLKTLLHLVFAILAFILLFFFSVPFPAIVLGALFIGFLIQFLSTDRESTVQQNYQAEANEATYYINSNSTASKGYFSWTKLLKQILISAILWYIPLVAFYFLSSHFDFWKNLILFFTKAAFVTFGGAYAVLPYVAQVSVEKLHWLTELQMIDGLALGETTPGPLVMVLVFVGFMAGFNSSGGLLSMGALGLITTTFYTFLPCFFFIFAGAPLIEKTRDNKLIKEALNWVTAAVVGVILNLTIYLGRAVLFPEVFSFRYMNWTAIAWLVTSLIALYKFKVNMIVWIGISALYGIILYMIGL